MGDETEVVHVAWGQSMAESIRDALRSRGCGASVIALSGAFNVGPIDSIGRAARRAWLGAHLRSDEASEDWSEPEMPWSQATAVGVHPVYWVCLTDAAEHASFLEFVFRMAGRPFDVVDATGLDIVTAAGISPVRSLGLLRPEDIVASGLAGQRRPFSRAEKDAAAAAWLQLRREDAPLRIVRDGRLVSAPLTHLGAVLTQQATPEWETVNKLIGRALQRLSCDVNPPGQGCSYELLFARILALGSAGALEITGPGPSMHEFTVRAPAAFRRPGALDLPT